MENIIDKPEEKPGKKRIVTACVLCGLFLTGTFFNHHIDKYLRNVNYLIISAVGFVLFACIVIYFIKSIKKSIKKRKQRKLKPHLPTLIYGLTLVLCYIIPNSEILESPTMVEAFHKSTQNEAVIKLRKDHTFEIHSWAVFGYNEWFTGTYTQKGDSLLLSYDHAKHEKLGSKILKKDGVLRPANKPADSALNYLQFKIYKDSK